MTIIEVQCGHGFSNASCINEPIVFNNIIILFFLPSRIQDVCIIFAIIVVFLVFFNTYIFQAGLVSLLIRKFKTTIIISITYLALSVGLHVWTMVSTICISIIVIAGKVCQCIISLEASLPSAGLIYCRIISSLDIFTL